MIDPLATEERHLVNIITKAVMPDYIKEGVLTRDKIGQALFDTFVQERIVEAKLSVWSPTKKVTMKDLLSCSQNKETLAIFLTAQLIECKRDSQTTYVVTSKGDCLASNSLPIQHLRSGQEEAHTRMLLHALDATHRGATSITFQSPGTEYSF